MKKHILSEDKLFTYIAMAILVVLSVFMVAPLVLVVSGIPDG